EGHGDHVKSVCLSADGRWALSGSWDNTLRLWEMATGKCVRTFNGHTNWIESVSLSADGRWALSASSDKTLKLWDVATGQCVRTVKWHRDDSSNVCLSPDGHCALFWSWDKRLRLWQVATGKCVQTFKGHEGRASSGCVSADGRWALSGGSEMGGSDNTVRLWDVATGERLRTFEGHTGGVTSVCLSADGRWVLSGSEDKTVRLWELDWELEAVEPADWDEDARPYAENFLTLCTPYAGVLPKDREPSEEEIQAALTRRGRPDKARVDKSFNWLLHTLGCAGYGWLRPEGVRRKLDEIAANWDGPPPLDARNTE
ncbi:MAG: WD40 repeat domain-containing protein, partial [Candidatus Hydrogenedentes bacterium]|nr:WD40 repeat domain-containing protein [Candidatus Hydrogenedentota bacterium]